MTPDERDRFSQYTYPMAVSALVNYDPTQTGVDHLIGTPGHLGILSRTGGFAPNTNIDDSRQRWLFRMVHSPAPLQEKMTLFWHHHFATAYSKLVTVTNSQVDSARMMAAVPSQDPNGARGQMELLRDHALGNFRNLLTEISKDIAMLYWLDNRLNTRNAPQENFGREIMELFTFGVENYTEPDVYAAARAFTGWGVVRTVATNGTAYWNFNYSAANHDTNPKTFTFDITAGNRTIPSRPAAQGMQDGIDLINALAIHPETAKRLARRLWTWFVSEVAPPDPAFVDSISQVYLSSDTEMKPVIRAVLLSPHFTNADKLYKRYSWPVEFVVRSLKEVGHVGFSADSARAPLLSMGQALFEPPDVAGWDLGPAWFSTAGMLARMNFAATLAQNQRFSLRDLSRPHAESPESLVDFVLESLAMPRPVPHVYQAYVDYVRAGGAWTGSETQLLNKTGGLFHLMSGSGEYQLV
jgi:uncharacterized protein (DUF1800 family)